ncbi:hypothetical protein SCHPADRAFT_947911, partial [Schizopora paradoxa]
MMYSSRGTALGEGPQCSPFGSDSSVSPPAHAPPPHASCLPPGTVRAGPSERAARRSGETSSPGCGASASRDGTPGTEAKRKKSRATPSRREGRTCVARQSIQRRPLPPAQGACNLQTSLSSCAAMEAEVEEARGSSAAGRSDAEDMERLVWDLEAAL